MLLLAIAAALIQSFGLTDASDVPPVQQPIPLVERVQGVPGTPIGYQAYELRTWGDPVVGRAKTLEVTPRNPNRIRIVLDGDASLEPRENVGALAPSIIFLPVSVHLDEKVLALRAGPRVLQSHEKPLVVFTEIVSERTPEFRTYTFTYDHIVFRGTVLAVSLGSGSPNSNGVWAGGITLRATPDLTVDYSDTIEPSRIRVPSGVTIPSELLPKPQ